MGAAGKVLERLYVRFGVAVGGNRKVRMEWVRSGVQNKSRIKEEQNIFCGDLFIVYIRYIELEEVESESEHVFGVVSSSLRQLPHYQ